MKKIVITGIADTRNNGCWAMAVSAITSIRETATVPVHFTVLSRLDSEDRKRLAMENVSFVAAPWTYFPYPKIGFCWIILSSFLIVLQAYLGKVLPLRFLFRKYWSIFGEADLVLDLSGDSISTDYNNISNVGVILPLLTAKLLKKNYYLCAQSLGPFNDSALSSLIVHVLKGATLITSRERLTDKILADLGVSDNVISSQDLALLLKPADPDRSRQIIKDEAIDPSSSWVGISISSIMSDYAFVGLPADKRLDAYLTTMAAFADHIVDTYGFNILFVSHVAIPAVSDDRKVTASVFAKMRNKDRAKLVEKDYLGSELKSLIGTCKYFVGSRMHATIAALTQCIPTITFVYNHKTLGINGDILGQTDFLIDIRKIEGADFLAACNDTFRHLVERGDEVKKQLMASVPLLQEASRRNAQLAVTLMDAAGPLAHMDSPHFCSGCGTCVSACPVHALSMRETPQGTLRPGLQTRCTGCRRCSSVCPALGLDLAVAQSDRFGTVEADSELGVCLSCWTGYSKDGDVRYNGASGGLVTEVASYLLDSGRVDAVLVVAADPLNPFAQRSRWAVNREELRAAQGSRYLPASVNDAFAEIPEGAMRLGVVGLPCHLWGVHLLEKKCLPVGRTIVFRLGLLCGRTPSLLSADALVAGLGATRRETKRLQFRGEGWPGTSRIDTDVTNATMPLSEMWGFIGTPFFTPTHCFCCPDFSAFLSDLSFGDAWLPQCLEDRVGTSLVLARTGEGEELLEELSGKGRIVLSEVAKADVSSAFRTNIRSKHHHRVVKSGIVGASFPVVHNCGKGGGSVLSWLSYRYDWFLGRLGSKASFCGLLRYPTGRFMRTLRKISLSLQKMR